MRKPEGRFWHDYALRTHIFALIAVIINLANVGANIAAAVAYSSMWYCSMAVYYFALGALRGGMLIANKQIGKRFEGGRLALAKTRMYLACGISLMVFEAALIYAVSEMVTEKVTSTGEIMAIAIAAYTFYKVILSIVNVKKTSRLHDPALQCLRNINLTDALVSLLSLQITMISVFDSGNGLARMNGITGIAVTVITLIIAVVMITQAARRLKEKEHEQGR